MKQVDIFDALHAYVDHLLYYLDIDEDDTSDDLKHKITLARDQGEYFLDEYLTPIFKELEKSRVR
jgi:hypothetical protein